MGTIQTSGDAWWAGGKKNRGSTGGEKYLAIGRSGDGKKGTKRCAIQLVSHHHYLIEGGDHPEYATSKA